jgi:thiamine biosynthesis lipoprotein
MNPVSCLRMQTVRLARHAMATRFEIVLHGDNPARLRGAGEEALAQVERIEAQLSIFQPTSEIARVNADAARQPVRVSPPVFRLLELARRLHDESGGAFDITIAPLVRCWGFMDGPGSWPDAKEVARVRRLVGMEHVILDAENMTVRFDSDGVMLDLGAIGKGYAIDRAVESLREAGATCALLHGGTSTVHGIGHPPGEEAWKVAIESPSGQGATPELLATVPLQDEAMSVSAVWGKWFEHDGKTFGHVLDPRAGQPVANAVLAAVVLPTATETDALSTALLVAGLEGHEKIAQLRPRMRTLVVGTAATDFRTESRGIVIKMREGIVKQRGNC